MIGNDVISEVDALMYDVLSKAENHVPLWGLVGTRECINVIAEVSHKPKSL